MRRRIRALSVGRAFGLAGAVLGAVAITFVVAGGIAIHKLTNARTALVEHADVARSEASDLIVALVDEETGVRGYILTGEPSFLAPYFRGAAAQAKAIAELKRDVARDDVELANQLLVVERAAKNWLFQYARPAIRAVDKKVPGARSLSAASAGKARFDAFRVAADHLAARLDRDRLRARTDLHDSAHTVTIVFYGFGALLLLTFAGVSLALRSSVTEPIARLSEQSRIVASGDFASPVGSAGLRDTRRLGEDVESLRLRVVSELNAVAAANVTLEQQRADLERSNQELEQFAYVASHDLQEPLRKVASFTQLLRQRYGGRLDAKADQYIDFAADGAVRMQQLINELLAFSRVGRLRDEETTVSIDELIDDALRSLAAAVESSGAVITRAALPVVRGERTLLALVFQNLIGNAIKFAGSTTPRIHVSHRRDGPFHEISVRDQGIGIDPEQADRIFVIFQRLHPKGEYPGTGIGLAMCRKIIEHHGGEIRLDTGHSGPGANVVFTLPALDDDAA